MRPSPSAFRRAILVAALAIVPGAAAAGQEIGPYVGGGVGGIRDVRRPFGGGISGTLLFHDWIGVRADAGYYWTLEHRTALTCTQGLEGPICSAVELSSHSHFPLLDGLLLLRLHVPHKGVRLEVGAGPSWVNVTNEIHTETDSVWSPRLTSSRAGAAVMAGIAAKPQWRVPITLEGSYVYHMTARFGACTNEPNDPICGQHLNFHELRFSALYRFR
jgi:opacity protein-like surface antigen